MPARAALDRDAKRNLRDWERDVLRGVLPEADAYATGTAIKKALREEHG
jgi:hypothetical protein